MARPAVLAGYAAPAWGPGPSPYAYPAPPPPSRTERGIAQFRWAVLVGIAMEGLALALIAYVASLMGELLASPSPFTPAFFSIVGTMIGLTCVSGVVGLVGAILFLIGLNYVYTGRDEFGPAHTQAVDHVIIFSILAIVFGIAAPVGSTFSSAFLGFGSGFTSFGTLGVIGGALGALRGMFVGLALATALKAFQSGEDRTVGLASAILLAASPAVSAVVGIAFPLTSAISDPGVLSTALTAWLGAAALGAGMDLVAYVLFFRVYSRTYHRMHAGEFAGMYRPPPMFVPYYPAPVPYYYPPPYPVQPAPPPAQPPQPPPSPPPGG